MDVTPLVKTGALIIQGYSAGQIRINGTAHETPLLVFSDTVEPWAAPGAIGDLTLDHFKPLTVRAAEIDVMLLGCGEVMKFLPPALKKELRAQNLHVETMDTGAACRTYNVLLAEGRRVVVGFLG